MHFTQTELETIYMITYCLVIQQPITFTWADQHVQIQNYKIKQSSLLPSKPFAVVAHIAHGRDHHFLWTPSSFRLFLG